MSGSEPITASRVIECSDLSLLDQQSLPGVLGEGWNSSKVQDQMEWEWGVVVPLNWNTIMDEGGLHARQKENRHHNSWAAGVDCMPVVRLSVAEIWSIPSELSLGSRWQIDTKGKLSIRNLTGYPLRPEVPSAALTSLSLPESQPWAPCSHHTCMPTTLLAPWSARPATPNLVLNLTGFTYLPVHTIIQMCKSHSAVRTREHLILLLVQHLSLTALPSSGCSRGQPPRAPAPGQPEPFALLG